jgi:hypothetical protein
MAAWGRQRRPGRLDHALRAGSVRRAARRRPVPRAVAGAPSRSWPAAAMDAELPTTRGPGPRARRAGLGAADMLHNTRLAEVAVSRTAARCRRRRARQRERWPRCVACRAATARLTACSCSCSWGRGRRRSSPRALLDVARREQHHAVTTMSHEDPATPSPPSSPVIGSGHGDEPERAGGEDRRHHRPTNAASARSPANHSTRRGRNERAAARTG